MASKNFFFGRKVALQNLWLYFIYKKVLQKKDKRNKNDTFF